MEAAKLTLSQSSELKSKALDAEIEKLKVRFPFGFVTSQAEIETAQTASSDLSIQITTQEKINSSV